jgi:hypothetical protein
MRLRCPNSSCNKSFPWEPGKGFPRFCPICGFDTATPDDRPEVAAPLVAQPRNRAMDITYRQMEQGSEMRAQMAADLEGVPVADMSDIKITNIRDSRHEGDVAAIPVVNDVSRAMDRINEMRPGTVGFGGSNAVEYSSAVQVGPNPNAGARARAKVRNFHGNFATGHPTATVTSMPALETQQPGYRHRVRDF